MRIINTDNAPKAVGPYSHAVECGGFVYVSGQLGIDQGTGKLGGGFETQTRMALANMGAILDAAGCAIGNIASVDVYLTDMSMFKDFNAIYEEFMAGHKPARAAIQVAGLPLGGLVEVRCVAFCE
jgi:2-iminobutanoate/2-iminopropanoate deaminase